MLELLDNFFRFGAIASLLFTSAIVLRDAGCQLAAKLAAFCCVSTAAYLLAAVPGLGDTIGLGMIPVLLVCIFGPPAIWLFCLSMFDDGFKIERKHYAVVAGFYVLGLIQHVNYYFVTGELPLLSPVKIHASLLDAGAFPWAISTLMLTMKLVIAVHLLVSAWQGRHDDLVVKRRHFREVFVVTVALISFGIILSETWLVNTGPDIEGVLLATQSASILLVGLYMLWHISGVDGQWLFGDYAPKETAPTSRSLSEDRHDLETLDNLSVNGTLLEAGLTISKLADLAGMPEHRLRRLVNQHLGYRNFADYLNFHRVEAAKSRLSAVVDRHVPVLTVAMDIGYSSLGPFNRAFKERAGMTPTEFRRKMLADC